MSTALLAAPLRVGIPFFGIWLMSRDRREKRDLHALDDDGMVLCNPRDKEAAHRAEMEGIATDDRAAVTCRKCLSLLYERDKARHEGSGTAEPSVAPDRRPAS